MTPNVVVPTASVDVPDALTLTPFVASFSSSDVDLSLRDDLSASVQDYLQRIADEFHALSAWTSTLLTSLQASISQPQRLSPHTQTHTHTHALAAAVASAPSPTAAGHLLVQTEVELLRRDIQLASHDVFQRCATQLAYVQNAVRSETDEQLGEQQRRLDDKLRFFAQKTLGAVETTQLETAGRLDALDRGVQRLQSDVQALQLKTAALETALAASVASLEAAQLKTHSELSLQLRRADALELSLTRQLGDVRQAATDAVQGLRATQTQLSAKLQVVRLELQESGEEFHRKFQQLNKFLSRVPVVGAQTVGAPAPTTPGAVKMGVGTVALSTSGADCFLYAKAALPQRDTRASGDAQSPPLSPRSASARRERPSPSRSARVVGNASCSDGGMEASLVVQASPRSNRDTGDSTVPTPPSTPRKSSVVSKASAVT
ncbi:hypothetical protein PINS_up006174 [Pythium insidiosum]|nr:hypothetical protein PINS_up006174 [Pythium insidiosum]